MCCYALDPPRGEVLVTYVISPRDYDSADAISVPIQPYDVCTVIYPHFLNRESAVRRSEAVHPEPLLGVRRGLGSPRCYLDRRTRRSPVSPPEEASETSRHPSSHGGWESQVPPCYQLGCDAGLPGKPGWRTCLRPKVSAGPHSPPAQVSLRGAGERGQRCSPPRPAEAALFPPRLLSQEPAENSREKGSHTHA